MCSSPPKVELVQRWRGVNSLNGAPCSHHPALGAKGSAISYHEDMPSPELADRALVDADAAESSAYESTFSRAVELAVEERHKRPLVERGGMGAEVLVVGSERHGISSSLYGGRGDDDVRDGLRHRSRVWPASGALEGLPEFGRHATKSRDVKGYRRRKLAAALAAGAMLLALSTLAAAPLPRCANFCSNRGFCDGDACICYPGFAGDDCSERSGARTKGGAPVAALQPAAVPVPEPNATVEATNATVDADAANASAIPASVQMLVQLDAPAPPLDGAHQTTRQSAGGSAGGGEGRRGEYPK